MPLLRNTNFILTIGARPMTELQELKAAKAVAAFLTEHGVDACEDKPNEYFAVMNEAFGGMPTEEEVWRIEALAKGQQND
jgi:hypothetical protein